MTDDLLKKFLFEGKQVTCLVNGSRYKKQNNVIYRFAADTGKWLVCDNNISYFLTFEFELYESKLEYPELLTKVQYKTDKNIIGVVTWVGETNITVGNYDYSLEKFYEKWEIIK